MPRMSHSSHVDVQTIVETMRIAPRAELGTSLIVPIAEYNPAVAVVHTTAVTSLHHMAVCCCDILQQS